MKKALFTVLASATLFACQTPNVGNPDSDTTTVALTIQKSMMTRSTLGGAISAGAVTAIENGTLYFFDVTGVFTDSHTLSEAEIDEAGIDNPEGGDPDEAADKILIQNVPTTSASVVMLANYDGEAPAFADLEAFADYELDIEDQSTMAGGAANAAVQGIALIDLSLGAGNALTPPTDNIRNANITLAPAVARIEIGNGAIKLADQSANNTTYRLESFDFSGIYVNHFYETYTLGGTTGTSLGQGDVTETDNLWLPKYLAAVPATLANLLYNEPTATTVVEGTAYPTGFAFHVFPGSVPHLVLRVSDLEYEDGTTTDAGDNYYWIIDEFINSDTDTTIANLERGHVYKIQSVELGKTIPRPDDPYDDKISVNVYVTVQAWDVVTVEVEPK
ncbi:MAG: hypothetical protein LBV38_05965 [Alistipes sp.]|jgi:hypothetical protein|nr:hypothetical protein [Alistipes sp.]